MLNIFDLPNNTTPVYYILQAERFAAYGDGGQHADLVLSPKGDGAIVFGPFPNNSRLGGNPRGPYAIDLQSNRGTATQVASAFGSIVLGISGTATNRSSIAIGTSANSHGLQSIAIGTNVQSAGVRSIAIGTDGTRSNGLNSIAIGDTAVASAQDSCAVGVGTIASAFNAFAFGDSAVSSGLSSVALGLSSTATQMGQLGYSNGAKFTTGTRQYSMFILSRTIANTTATDLTLNGRALVGVTNAISIPVGRVMGFFLWITGIRSNGSSHVHYTRKGFIRNVAGTTSVTTTPVAMGADEDPDGSVQTLLVTGNNTNDTLQIQITLQSTGQTWRFAAVVHAIEYSFGT